MRVAIYASGDMANGEQVLGATSSGDTNQRGSA